MGSAAERDIILTSDYNTSDIKFTHNRICDALLEKALENIKDGRNKWMTNSTTGETLTFSDVGSISKKVASFMVKHGMVKGDKCIYLTSDVTRIYAIMIGIWRAGGIVCSSYAEDTEGLKFI